MSTPQIQQAWQMLSAQDNDEIMSIPDREAFERIALPSFPQAVSKATIEDHWQTWQEAWQAALYAERILEPQKIYRLTIDREHARAKRDFATSDRIRSQLLDLGVVVDPGPQGERILEQDRLGDSTERSEWKECSGNPRDCPENEGHGCCMPNHGLEPSILRALQDALSGWQYIRSFHGDLYGVAWDRVEERLKAALAVESQSDNQDRGKPVGA